MCDTTVTIDYEDREQVERLMRVVRDRTFESGDTYPGMTRFAGAMQAALREFADPTPPKPEEPTGRFAVVVDSDDREWVSFDDRWASIPGPNALIERRLYRDIDAVKVLSDGIPA